MLGLTRSKPAEIDPRLEAESIPPNVAYYAALRILNHAAATRHRDLPMSQIPALEALEHWQSSMIEPRSAAPVQSGRPAWDRERVADISDPDPRSLVPGRPTGAI